MSTPALRPPRTTPNLQLPIPGDAGPADYVTDTGALADQIDSRVNALVGGLTPGIGPTLPSNPADGAVFDWTPNQAAFGARLPFMWRMRALGGVWWQVGGSVAHGYDGAGANWPGPTNGVNYVTPGPYLYPPVAGIYEVGGSLTFNYPGVAVGAVMIGTIASQNLMPAFSYSNNSTTVISVNASIQPFVIPLSAGDRVAWYITRTSGTLVPSTAARLITIRPVRIP